MEIATENVKSQLSVIGQHHRRSFFAAVWWWRTAVVAAMCVGGTGCWSSVNNDSAEVIVYAALDREFSEPILKRFERETGIRVLAKYDVESTKTVGLVSAIMQERQRPRCDLFWNNEVLHTLRLDRAGLLAGYDSPTARDLPAAYRGSQHQWFGFAARARVLIVNKALVPRDQFPRSITDLVDPKWEGQTGVAKPLFGTTATHAAVLFAQWGDQRAAEFFQQVRDRCQILSGNKKVAVDVASGRLKFGLTDTDDAIIEIDQGQPVEIVFPDQADGELGTLLIPNTLALVQDSPHPAAARRLVDYLLRPEIERELAAGRSAQFPVRGDDAAASRAFPTQPVRWMSVDFAAAAEKWETAAKVMQELFVTAN